VIPLLSSQSRFCDSRGNGRSNPLLQILSLGPMSQEMSKVMIILLMSPQAIKSGDCDIPGKSYAGLAGHSLR